MAEILDEFLGTESTIKGLPEIQEPEKMGKWEAFGRGAAQEGSWGFSDEIEGALKGLYYGDRKEQITAARALNDLAEKDQETAYKTGEVVGMVGPILLMLASGIGAPGAITNLTRVFAKYGFKKGIKMAGKTAKTIVKKGKTNKAARDVSSQLRKELKTLSKKGGDPKATIKGIRKSKEGAAQLIAKERRKELASGLMKGSGRGVLEAGASSGIYAYGKSESDDPWKNIKMAGEGAKSGAPWGVLFPFAKTLLKAPEKLSTPALKILSDMSEEQLNFIKRNPTLFRNVKTKDEIRQKFLEMVNDLQTKESVYAKRASKFLKDDDVIPQEYVTDPIEQQIQKLEESFAGGKASAPIVQDLLKKLEDLKSIISTENAFVSEKRLKNLYDQWKAEAYKHGPMKDTPDSNQLFGRALREIRYGWKTLLQGHNPKWNKEMAPVRNIEELMGGSKRARQSGLADSFELILNPTTRKFEAAQTIRGKENLTKHLDDAFSAPFRKNGLITERPKRDLLNDMDQLHQDLKLTKKTPDTLLKKGEASVIEETSLTAGPKTGWQVLGMGAGAGTGLLAGKASGDETEGLAWGMLAGSILAKIKANHGKRIAQQSILGVKESPKIQKGLELLKRSEKPLTSPLGIQKAIAVESVEGPVLGGGIKERHRKGEWSNREKMLNYLRKRRGKTDVGEEYGFGRYTGVKEEQPEIPKQETPLKENFLESFLEETEETPKGSFLETNESEEIDFKDPEKEQREKNAISFLRQQKGLIKPKYT